MRVTRGGFGFVVGAWYVSSVISSYRLISAGSEQKVFRLDSFNDLSDTPCRWTVNYRTNDGGRCYCCGRDSSGRCDRMITAAATVVGSAMVAGIYVDIAINVKHFGLR